jgi:hypothetical protein
MNPDERDRVPYALREERAATAGLRRAYAKLAGQVARLTLPALVVVGLFWWFATQFSPRYMSTGEVGVFDLVAMTMIIIVSVYAMIRFASYREDLTALEDTSKALERSRQARELVQQLREDQRASGGSLSVASSSEGGDLSLAAERGAVTEHAEVTLDLDSGDTHEQHDAVSERARRTE